MMRCLEKISNILLRYTLQGTNISHLWKRNIIFKCCLFRGYASFRACTHSLETHRFSSFFQRLFFQTFSFIKFSDSQWQLVAGSVVGIPDPDYSWEWGRSNIYQTILRKISEHISSKPTCSTIKPSD